MAKSPTELSLAVLRAQGYACWIVEYYNSFTRRRHDLYGAWDIMAVREGEVLLVQTTSGSNVSARVKKIAENEYTPILRSANVRLEIHGWTKKKVGRRLDYKQRIVDVS